MKCYKLWEYTRNGIENVIFIQAKNLDEAFIEARKAYPNTTAGQLYSEIYDKTINELSEAVQDCGDIFNKIES